jgi:hypothetical protein
MVADDLDVVVSLLAASFQDRPFYQYIAPNPDERRSFLIANFYQRITQGLDVNEIDLAVVWRDCWHCGLVAARRV